MVNAKNVMITIRHPMMVNHVSQEVVMRCPRLCWTALANFVHLMKELKMEVNGAVLMFAEVKI
jgi:hypothetical protein